jgi:hypothetical protein
LLTTPQQSHAQQHEPQGCDWPGKAKIGQQAYLCPFRPISPSRRAQLCVWLSRRGDQGLVGSALLLGVVCEGISLFSFHFLPFSSDFSSPSPLHSRQAHVWLCVWYEGVVIKVLLDARSCQASFVRVSPFLFPLSPLLFSISPPLIVRVWRTPAGIICEVSLFSLSTFSPLFLHCIHGCVCGVRSH